MTRDRICSPEERAAYRRWVREHHPDVGGDPQEFAAGLARLRTAWDTPAHADRYDAPVEFVGDHQRLRAALTRLLRRFRRYDPPRVH